MKNLIERLLAEGEKQTGVPSVEGHVFLKGCPSAFVGVVKPQSAELKEEGEGIYELIGVQTDQRGAPSAQVRVHFRAEEIAALVQMSAIEPTKIETVPGRGGLIFPTGRH